MSRAPFAAVIFDLDGVLWDGEPVHQQALNVVLAPYGHVLSDEEYSAIIGTSVVATWVWLRDRFGLTCEPYAFWRDYDAAVLRLLEGRIEPLSGVRPLVEQLRQRNVPMAVASSSLRPWVDATLRGLGLEAAFDAVVTATEVTNSKPAPDLYTAAAERISVSPDLCIAVEDALPGIMAARAAGMFAVQVRSASTAPPPLDEADLVIDSLVSFPLSMLNGDGRGERP